MVEVAAILTDPTGTRVLDRYEAKVLPKKPVDVKAAAVNGYSAEKWAAEGAVELDAAMFRILGMARNAVFVAHNVAFDWAFFEVALAKRHQKWPGDYHRICTVALSLPLLQAGKVPNQKLTTLTNYFGIEHSNAHTAMADAEGCRQVYVKLMEIYAPLFAASAAPTP
jgi:DNA polymerase III epsilon subunit-like protein